MNEATHSQVAFRGTRITNLTTLKYNADDISIEGEIVVPKELRSDWSLDIGLQRQLGPNASNVVLMRMSSKQDFERPKVNVLEEKSATPEIKMGNVEVVKTPVDPAVLKAARKDMKFVSDYNLDRKEVKSGKDCRLNIPSNLVLSDTRREIVSLSVTKTTDGKLKVVAKVKGGLKRDNMYVRLRLP